MAAAYLFHIANNHAFHDGNKRTAALAALVFLEVNGAESLPAPEELEEITLRVAASRRSDGAPGGGRNDRTSRPRGSVTAVGLEQEIAGRRTDPRRARPAGRYATLR